MRFIRVVLALLVLLVAVILPLPQTAGANHRPCATESVIFTPPGSGPIQVGSEWDGILFDGESPSGAHVFVMFLTRIEEHNRPAGPGTWYAICYQFHEDFAQGPNNPVFRALNSYRNQHPQSWVQLVDMRSGSYHLSADFNRPDQPAPPPAALAPAPVSTPSCRVEQFFPPIQNINGGFAARDIRPPHEGWWGVVFDGQVRPSGPQVYGILGVHTPEVLYVQGTWYASRCDPGPLAMEMARVRHEGNPGLSIEVWEGREERPRMAAAFGPPASPPVPAPSPAPGVAVCAEEARELVPVLSQSFDGRVRAVVFPPADFPTAGIVFEGLPWRNSPVHVEIHRAQPMEVVYFSGTFRAVCTDPMGVALSLASVHRAAGRWGQIWDVRPSGPRQFIDEFNRPPHIPTAVPAAPAQCLEPTPSRRGVPPDSGDDLAQDVAVFGPAVVQVQWSGLISRPIWAQDRTILTIVPHGWEGIFPKVRHITVWSFSQACTMEHLNREMFRASENTGFEIRGIEEIRGSGLFQRTRP